MIVGYICNRHGYIRGGYCPECAKTKVEVASFNSYKWCSGWYEHIADKPIYIEDRKHLLRECRRHGVIPKALSGPKSRGKGIEVKGR